MNTRLQTVTADFAAERAYLSSNVAELTAKLEETKICVDFKIQMKMLRNEQMPRQPPLR